MRLIKPSEISARILTLLEESDERVIIVSPYVKIAKWYKLIKKVKGLKSRKVIVEIYVRDDPENHVTYHDLDRLELEYYKIPNLHCKLYMNERYGIVTSMNLLLTSEINSLEIGYLTESLSEYNDLQSYYHRYIRTGGVIPRSRRADLSDTDLRYFLEKLMDELERSCKNAWLWISDTKLHITTGYNSYEVYFNGGYLRVKANLKPYANLKLTANLKNSAGRKQQNTQSISLIVQKIEALSSMEVDILPGSVPDNLLLLAQTKQNLNSKCVTGILEEEEAYLIESVSTFIDAADNLLI